MHTPAAEATRLLIRQLLDQGYGEQDVLSLVEEELRSVPATIFEADLTPLEALARGVPEERWQHLGRPRQVLARARENSLRKHPEEIRPAETPYRIPLGVFADLPLSPMEAACWDLQQRYRLRNKEIAALLGKDEKTIWTALDRAKKKLGGGQ